MGRLTAVMALFLWASGCATTEPSAPDDPGDEGNSDVDAGGQQPDSGEPVAASGTLRVLSYNVAGLPQGVSGSDPIVNTPLMSPLLNNYQLALVQEDFSYHDELAAQAQHPHQSIPLPGSLLELGDGLNRFSRVPFTAHEREAWDDCNGLVGDANDCLTKKGYSFARHELADGVEVDVYNLHFDAGRDPNDAEARRSQVEQLLEAFEARSTGRALLVVGDFNMKEEDESDLARLMSAAELTDACRSTACSEPNRIDRIMVRASSDVDLRVSSWELDLSFVDSAGEDLSDHQAVAATVEWRTP